MPHDFHERLRFSESARHEPFWIAVYQRAFPDLATWYFNNRNNGAQRAGIDRVLVLRGGKTISIDEKTREQAFEDIALEFVSVSRTGHEALGWMEKDLLIDYLAYAVLPLRRCYVLPWLMLRRAWLHHRSEWIEKALRKRDGFKLVEAPNRGYVTKSVAVPAKLLLGRVGLASVIQIDAPSQPPSEPEFGANDEELLGAALKPLPFTRDGGAQQSFDFEPRRSVHPERERGAGR